ncbi:MAG: class I tRNA ligase family protein, partial [Candidatus Korarchaeota archaeon]|nr:class I tRNA ligase family protein [Candidatus Korarchaeota archaeon]NIU84412.1 class I tRNA ligase family protein [Candidatus Thorarchaeota archaeon]NIW14522.1 class I tRNA ligase family protein [Candidatus Thorarchaeota archaeon]
LDPKDLLDPRCALCGGEPIFKKTKHWYLDLPQLSSRLKAYVEQQDQWAKKVKNLTLSWIEEGLKPRPITRDVKFGIPAPFPGAEGK